MTEQQSYNDDDLRELAAQIFAPDEPDEPEPRHGLRIPAEGSSPPTRITAEMVNRDFAKRLFDDEYDIINSQLPEEGTTP